MQAARVRGSATRAHPAPSPSRAFLSVLLRTKGQGTGLPHVWGSGSGCKARVCVVRWREPLPEVGTEGAIVDRAANLQQKISTTSRPAHLLRLVHPAIH